MYDVYMESDIGVSFRMLTVPHTELFIKLNKLTHTELFLDKKTESKCLVFSEEKLNEIDARIKHCLEIV
jgi:hypothetical protein